MSEVNFELTCSNCGSLLKFELDKTKYWTSYNVVPCDNCKNYFKYDLELEYQTGYEEGYDNGYNEGYYDAEVKHKKEYNQGKINESFDKLRR